jgi:alkylhydroperoxidase family enzyme
MTQPSKAHPILGADQPEPLVAAEIPTGLEAEAKRKLGLVPRLVSFVAPSPWLPRAMLDLMTLAYSHADPGLTRLVAVVASYENACRYCYGTSRTVLRMLEHRSRKAPLDRRARWVTARSTAIWIGCTKRSTSGASHDLCG